MIIISQLVSRVENDVKFVVVFFLIFLSTIRGRMVIMMIIKIHFYC
jgi:hypothetical protein